MKKQAIRRVLKGMGKSTEGLAKELEALAKQDAPDTTRWLALYTKARRFSKALTTLDGVNFRTLRLALRDRIEHFPEAYKAGPDYLAKTDAMGRRVADVHALLAKGDDKALRAVADVTGFYREALLDNPLLDFDQMLLVKRSESNLGLPQNWQGNCALPKTGYDNQIALIKPFEDSASPVTLFEPEAKRFVGDIDLHFDGDRFLFSMPGSRGRWQIWEMSVDGDALRQVTLGEHPDVDNYDACYLPDERVIFASTRAFQGVPCVGGGNTVANLCIMNPDGTAIRQLCFDQDHNWCPTVLNDGRVLYTRWEYSDTPHYFSRLLFSMNPDGTNQMEYYGSNSHWPNSMFYARPIPGHPTQVAAIVSGHHGVPRMGELVIFDPAKGRFEADGVVQRIPGYGEKVEPVIVDALVDASWPKFLHPFPLNDTYFIVSCKPRPGAPWGIYLVDRFDNMVCLAETPGYALLEPTPVRTTNRPPVVPDKVRLEEDEATVYLADIYAGPGLEGVPRGNAKRLRLFEFYYAYPQMGGHVNVGVEGAWDVHRILGTVPIREDGSALFKVPANMPVAVQPLDERGRAIQLMRSWFVGMPGETISCIGCHEQQNASPPARQTIAARGPASEIEPWYGPARGFSFKRDVQPVLDEYCVGCHTGGEASGNPEPDLSGGRPNGWNNFTPAYLALHPYVRRPGPESNYNLLNLMEFHANTSELVQMLQKGHYGVTLDAEAWERLYAWIDLNVPDHGTWGEHREIPADFHERRMLMRTRYANRPEDPEVIPAVYSEPAAFVKPNPVPKAEKRRVKCPDWPFSAQEAQQLQAAAGTPNRRTLDLGNGVTLDLTLIPAGQFVMGSSDGYADEQPLTRVAIDEAFWMGTLEVTNGQFQQFDPAHSNGFLDQHHKDHVLPGYTMEDPNLPVMRVSWQEAVAFCAWLSERTGEAVSLPTEAQWEWACRAGADTALSYGDVNADFTGFANLADVSLRKMAVTGVNPQPIANPNQWLDFIPKDARFNDGAKLMSIPGAYAPNSWGLHDMHGNVWEWTRSDMKPYPYDETDGRNALDPNNDKVVRGGSWRDRPKRARSSYRLAYMPYQKVFNVGFRVVVSAGESRSGAMMTAQAADGQ